MKTREETARFVEQQFEKFGSYQCPMEKGVKFHYGKQDVRALLDFIYDGPPIHQEEEVRGLKLRNRR